MGRERWTSVLAEQASTGKLQVPIQRIFVFAEAREALAAFSAGTRGKIVITVG